MIRDPIVEEVRAIREAFAKKHGYNVQSIVRALQREEAQGGRRVLIFATEEVSNAEARREGRVKL